MSGTVCVTFVVGDEDKDTVGVRDAVRRETCDVDPASRCLALGVLAGQEKFRSGSSGSMYVTFVSGDQFAAEPARDAER